MGTDGEGQARAREHESIKEKLREVIKEELTDRLFNPSNPTSLQAQITKIDDRAFGDDPKSLFSRQTELEKKFQFGKLLWACLCFLVGGAAAFFAFNFKTFAGWFGFVPKSSGLHIVFYHKVARFNAAMGRYWDAVSVGILCVWPRAVWFVRKFWG